MSLELKNVEKKIGLDTHIYPSNLNHDPERHWFFTYYSAVHLLHSLDYSFNCRRVTWMKVQKKSGGKLDRDLKSEFKGNFKKEI